MWKSVSVCGSRPLIFCCACSTRASSSQATDQPRLLLLIIGCARPTPAEVPLTDLSFSPRRDGSTGCCRCSWTWRSWAISSSCPHCRRARSVTGPGRGGTPRAATERGQSLRDPPAIPRPALPVMPTVAGDAAAHPRCRVDRTIPATIAGAAAWMPPARFCLASAQEEQTRPCNASPGSSSPSSS